MNEDIKANNTEYLVNKYLNDVIRLALVYVRNMDDAEDIAQQVFVAYLHKRPLFTDEHRAKSWLLSVCANCAKNHLRSKKDVLNFDELAGILSTEDTDIGQSAKELAVLEAVLRLKPVHREVVHLYYYDDYSTEEIAQILKIPLSTVHTRLYRARKILKDQLKGGEHFETQLQECNE